MQNLSVRGIENARNGNCNKWTMQRKFIVFVGLEMQRIICIIAGIGTCKEWKMQTNTAIVAMELSVKWPYGYG